MIRPSTFSIVACDLEEKSWGVAVASKFPAVGTVVPWAEAQVGAVATQMYANTSYGPKGLRLMAAGKSAEETLNALLDSDPDRETRQVGIVDFEGKSISYTGHSSYEWAGGIAGPCFAIQGNLLVGEEVVLSMAEAFTKTSGTLYRKLHASLFAGDRSGGDRRGRQSAAIIVVKDCAGYGGFNDRWIDYRVDDHTDPVFRLGELLDLHDLYFGVSPQSEKVSLIGDRLVELQKILFTLGYLSGEVNGEFDQKTREALKRFIGNENFEERVDFDLALIDEPVYKFLVRRFGFSITQPMR